MDCLVLHQVHLSLGGAVEMVVAVIFLPSVFLLGFWEVKIGAASPVVS